MLTDHHDQVKIWAVQATAGRSFDELLLLFDVALQAIRERLLITLSDVTVNAIFDRALHQAQQKFKILSEVKLEAGGIDLHGIAQGENLPAEKIIESFQFFITELIIIFGNLTAEILSKPLYDELYRVSSKPLSLETYEDDLRTLISPKGDKGQEDV